MEEISHTLLGTNPQSLLELPSSKIHLSRGVVRVLAHDAKSDEKSFAAVPRSKIENRTSLDFGATSDLFHHMFASRQ